MEENTISISYTDLDDNLKDEVRENFRNDDYLVPDDWWSWELEGLKESFPLVDFNEDKVEFDIYRNDFNIQGSIDTQHSDAPKLSDKFYEFYDKEWLYDVMFNFNNSEFHQDYSIGEDTIYDDIEREIFPEDIEVDGGKIELDVSIFKKPLQDALEKYNSLKNPDITNQLEQWLREIDAAGIFFAESIVIEEDDYDNFLEELRGEMVSQAESLVEEAYDTMQPILDDFYSTFVDRLKQSYDYYYTDEYADEALSDKTFEVEVDEDGNQLEVVDLNGEW